MKYKQPYNPNSKPAMKFRGLIQDYFDLHESLYDIADCEEIWQKLITLKYHSGIDERTALTLFGFDISTFATPREKLTLATRQIIECSVARYKSQSEMRKKSRSEYDAAAH